MGGWLYMELRVNARQLYNCLEITEKALPVRSTIPIINNILLDVAEDKMTFLATNLEMAIKVTMDKKEPGTGKILLPPKIIDIMRYFPVSEATLDINWDSYGLKVSGGSALFNLNGADAQDYPATTLFQLNYDSTFSIEQELLKKELKAVIFAASAEETRPAFNGVLFSFEGDKIFITASDTYRLVIKEISNNNWSFEYCKCLVPARVLREFLRIIEGGKENIIIGFDNKTMSFNFNEINLSSRLLEEKYPDVRGVIPGSYKTRIKINRKQFEEVISRAALLTEGKNQAVNLILHDDQLEARVSGQEGKMEEILPVEQDGENINLHVNTRFILDILRVIDEKEMIIDFHGNEGPIIFRLIDDQSYLYLVLPIKRLN